MTGLNKAYRTNTAKEIQGFTLALDEAPNDDGTIPTFILARTGGANVAYSKALEVETRPYRRQIELGTLKPEIAEEALLKVFCKTIVKGWSNVQDEDGNVIAFSEQAAIELLGKEDMKDLYSRLRDEANTAANYRDAMRETEKGN